MFFFSGNCSPRFMRSTMYNIPCNKDLLQASSIPLATVITPFAEPGPSEVSGSVIILSKKKNWWNNTSKRWHCINCLIFPQPSLRIMDYSPTGPVRCNRCKAYMNPFVQFVDGGRRFMCNICSYSSEGSVTMFLSIHVLMLIWFQDISQKYFQESQIYMNEFSYHRAKCWQQKHNILSFLHADRL